MLLFLLFAAPASGYHGILSKGCGPGLYAPLNYPNNPCIFCPPGRWSNTTNAETRMEVKCSGICAEAFVCGCPGSTESAASVPSEERCDEPICPLWVVAALLLPTRALQAVGRGCQSARAGCSTRR